MTKAEEMEEIISDLLQEIEQHAFRRYQETDARKVVKKWAKEMATVHSFEHAEALHRAMRRAVAWHKAIAHLPEIQK